MCSAQRKQCEVERASVGGENRYVTSACKLHGGAVRCRACVYWQGKIVKREACVPLEGNLSVNKRVSMWKENGRRKLFRLKRVIWKEENRFGGSVCLLPRETASVEACVKTRGKLLRAKRVLYV